MSHSVQDAQGTSMTKRPSWPSAVKEKPEAAGAQREKFGGTAVGDKAKREAAGRLRQLRIAAGYETASDAAQAIGVTIVTYQHHENGTRGIHLAAAERYGTHYGVPALHILYGLAHPNTANTVEEGQGVPLIGGIAPDGRVIPRMSQTATFPKTVPGPPSGWTASLQALVVQANSFYPAYNEGDVLFYDQPSPLGLDMSQVDGRECVVLTTDGQMLLRTCYQGPNGTWTLIALGAPPMQAVRLVSASPILWVQRRGHAVA